MAFTGERLIAVGERGDIVASRDGIHWAQVDVPVRSTLTAVAFVDANNGWAVGHDAAIVHTSDGGRTWSLQNFNPALLKPLHDVLFLDASRGFAVGAFGSFLVTKDGGATWTELDAPSIREDGMHFNAITRLNDGQLLVVGEGGMLGVSTDGTTWDRLKSPYEGTFFGAIARGDKGVLVFGLRGNAFASDDVRSGNWRKVNLATISTIFGGVSMSDGSTVVVGADATVLIIMPNDSIERAPTYAGVPGTGTIASITRWSGGLMTAGEEGVQPYQTKWVASSQLAAPSRTLEPTSDFK